MFRKAESVENVEAMDVAFFAAVARNAAEQNSAPIHKTADE